MIIDSNSGKVKHKFNLSLPMYDIVSNWVLSSVIPISKCTSEYNSSLIVAVTMWLLTSFKFLPLVIPIIYGMYRAKRNLHDLALNIFHVLCHQWYTIRSHCHEPYSKSQQLRKRKLFIYFFSFTDGSQITWPSRLLLCLGMASKWPNLCNWQPRQDMPCMGHTQPLQIHRCLARQHWCNPLCSVHIWWPVHGHGWTSRFCACLWCSERV